VRRHRSYMTLISRSGTSPKERSSKFPVPSIILGRWWRPRGDYERSTQRLNSGVVGSLLKTLLATKTTVFVDYSLRDEDFVQIYTAVRAYLADFHKLAYFIAPHISADDRGRLSALNLHLIETDGAYFIENLKAHALSIRCMSPDSLYDRVSSLLVEVVAAHAWLYEDFDIGTHPSIIICACYQDGLIHGLERVVRLRKSGEYSDRHRVLNLARNYTVFAQRYRRDKRFDDAAYCEGYANAMLFAALDPEIHDSSPPLFFNFGGFETSKPTAYKRMIRKLPQLHKAPHRFVKRIADKYRREDRIVVHHLPQLNLGRYVTENSGPTENR
jgi:hypothetical protein